jgi:3-methyl-2-oxobutanoate hydroxymethyltransferase
MKQEMQAERVAGFRDFIRDVKSGGFPGPEHVITAPDGLIQAFIDQAGRGDR